MPFGRICAVEVPWVCRLDHVIALLPVSSCNLGTGLRLGRKHSLACAIRIAVSKKDVFVENKNTFFPYIGRNAAARKKRGSDANVKTFSTHRTPASGFWPRSGRDGETDLNLADLCRVTFPRFKLSRVHNLLAIQNFIYYWCG